MAIQPFRSLNDLSQLLKGRKAFLLCDDHTARYCLPLLPPSEEIPHLILPHGEEMKQISYAIDVWNWLYENGAGRDAVLINLGGGTITDLGGFCASTFKRGISFIHVPTTLLAMTDAALGGKTGINFGGSKNQIGTFAPAEAIILHIDFLKTLPARELRAGWAETFKHALIGDPKLWEELQDIRAEDYSQELIHRSVRNKLRVVEADFLEKDYRQVLNFGHTIGHALEARSHLWKVPLLHGEAIAAGMVMAAWLSVWHTGLAEILSSQIISRVHRFFGKIAIPEEEVDAILSLLQQDKKNKSGQLQFVLLGDIGVPVLNVRLSEEDVSGALQWYVDSGHIS